MLGYLPFVPAINPLTTMGIINIIGILIASKNGLKKKHITVVIIMLKKLTVKGFK